MQNTRPVEDVEVQTICESCDSVMTWNLPKKNEFGDLERENKKCIGCDKVYPNTILFERFKGQIALQNEPFYTVLCPYCKTQESLKLSAKQACGNFSRAAAKCKNCDAIFTTFYDKAKDTLASCVSI